MTLYSTLRKWADNSVNSAEADDEVVVKTSRYLRLSMIALIVGLTTAVLYEHAKSHLQDGSAGRCWQHSISAYYYTPVQSFFVAALVAIGISLIALKGSTELEDVCLNFAGIFAPVVAFVPTPNVGDCGSKLTDKANRDFNIGNNVMAMLIMAGVALAALVALWLFHHAVTDTEVSTEPNAWAHWIAIGGYVLAVGLYVVAWILFMGARKWFTDHAHNISAFTMFVFIFLAVVNNAINFHFTRDRVVKQQDLAHAKIKPADKLKPPRQVNRYLVIAILMAAAFLIINFGPWFGDYATIWLEASMITLFAVFWVIQTHELWHRGLRAAVVPRQSGGDTGGEPSDVSTDAEAGE